MKFRTNTYKLERIITGTKEIELSDTSTKYIMGRSGGDSYVACIIPEVRPTQILERTGREPITIGGLIGYYFISRNDSNEGKIFVSIPDLQDWERTKERLKILPHYEDIINYVLNGEGDEQKICSQEYFESQLKSFRKL